MKRLLTLILFVLLIGNAWGQTTIFVTDSEANTPLDKVKIQYLTDGSWKTFGSTGSDGRARKNIGAGTFDFSLTYLDIAAYIANVAIAGNDTVYLQKKPVTAGVYDSYGNPIANVYVQYKKSGSWVTFGYTDSTGTVSREMFETNLDIRTYYNYQYCEKFNVDVSGNVPVEFQTKKITALLTDSDGNPLENVFLSYNVANSWRTFGKTDSTGKAEKEFFPGSIRLRASYSYTVKESDEITFTESTEILLQTAGITVSVSGSDGNGLKRAKVYYREDTNWRFAGYTDSTGTLKKQFFPATLDFKANYNYTEQEKAGVSFAGGEIIAFQTKAVTAFVHDAGGAGIYRAKISYNNTDSWRTFGYTDSAGIAVNQFFPSVINLRSTCNYTTAESGETAFSESVTIPFQTVRVTADVVSSENEGIGRARIYYREGESWRFFGYTDSTGSSVREFFPAALDFKAVYNYTELEKPGIGFSGNKTVTFQTKAVRASVKDSGGEGIRNAKITYNTSTAWRTFGYTDSTGIAVKEFFPATINLMSTYNYSSAESGNVTFTESVTIPFQTLKITAEAVSSGGEGVERARIYYRNGSTSWRYFGYTDSTGTVSKEYFPATMDFRANYNTSSAEQLNIAFSGPQTVSFQTKQVTVRVNDTEGTGLKRARIYYRNGETWRTFGYTDSTGIAASEFFDAVLDFKASYNYTDVEINQINTAQQNEIVFTAKKISAFVKDSGGNGIYRARIYYDTGSGWRTFGYTDSTGYAVRYFFPATINLKAQYNYSYQESGDVVFSESTVIPFQTLKISALVTDSDGGGINRARIYYREGSSWRTFGYTDSTGVAAKEFFPATFDFQASYNTTSFKKDDVSFTSAATIPFQTNKISVHAVSSDGEGLNRAKIYYRNGDAWRTFGYTDSTGSAYNQFFDAVLDFKALYNSTDFTRDAIDLSTDRTVQFQTSKLSARVESPSGEGVRRAKVYYNTGNSWRTLGYTDSTGFAHNQFFPAQINFKALLNNTTSLIENYNFTGSSEILFPAEEITVSVKGLADNPVKNVKIQYRNDVNWYTFGRTDIDGITTRLFFPTTLDFKAFFTDYAEIQRLTFPEQGTQVNFVSQQEGGITLTPPVSGWGNFEYLNNMLETRFGDGEGPADWELGFRTEEGGFSPVVQERNFAWENGIAQNFSLSYDNASGTFTFTLRDKILAYSYADFSGKGIVSFSLLAKTDMAGRTAEFTSLTLSQDDKISNLGSLQGTNEIVSADISGLNGSDFVLAGKMKYSWDETAVPSGSEMELMLAYSTESIDSLIVINKPVELWVGPDGNDQNIGSPEQPLASIQAAIDKVAEGGTVHVLSGIFTENVSIGKRIYLSGAGSGSDPLENTVIRKLSDSPVISVNASGLSENEPVLLQGLRIEPAGVYGIDISNDSTAYFIELEDIYVSGSSQTGSNENEIGLMIGQSTDVRYLKINNTGFENLDYGLYFAKHGDFGESSSNVNYISVSNTVFQNNVNKGVYIEKLSNAEFTNVSIIHNGTNADFWNADWNCGMDINLKGEIQYENLTFTNLTVTQNGLGFKYGAGIWIKARDDGNIYGAHPASLTNVTITGGSFTGNESGIMFGVPGDLPVNAGPAGAIIKNAVISANIPQYSGADSIKTGGLVNNSSAQVLAPENYWGSASGPSGIGGGSGDAVYGNVVFAPFYTTADLSALDALIINANQNTYHSAIQEAVDSAVENDVILIKQGFFTENVIVNKTGIVFSGPNFAIAGDETRIAEADISGYLKIDADNIVVKGLKFSSGGLVPSGEYAGIYITGGKSGIEIKNNIFSNSSGTAPNGFDASRGIINEYGGISSVSVVNNLFSGWHTGLYLQNASGMVNSNTFSGNMVGISVDGPEGVDITWNTIISNAFEGIGIGPGTSGNYLIHINNNSIYGNATYTGETASEAVKNYVSTFTADAENNWWGDASGPSGSGFGSGDPVSANVDFDPWLDNLPEYATSAGNWDFENGSVSGWTVYAGGGDAGCITNIFNSDHSSRVISLIGPNGDTNDGFMLKNADGSLLSYEANTAAFIMNFSSVYEIYFWVETDAGKRYVYYKPVDTDPGYNDWGTKYIGIGLGANFGINNWQAVSRNLQEDLNKYENGVTILSIEAIQVRGAGMMDDISLSIETPPKEIDGTVVEDAEDDDVVGWTVYAGGGNVEDNINNVYDAARNSKVLEFAGPNGDTNDGFMYKEADGSLLSLTANKITWSMNFNDLYEVFIWAETSAGKRYIYYKPNDTDEGYNDWGTVYIGLGLGAGYGIGSWETVTRDLQADLNLYDPDVTINEIKAIMVRGCGRVDDIIVDYTAPDTSDTDTTATTDYSIIENAEDGDITGWTVYAGGGTAENNIHNVFDTAANSNVIELAGPNGDTNDGFKYCNSDGSLLELSANKISWSMNFSTHYEIFFWVETSAGKRLIYYEPQDTDDGYNDWGTVYIGLGLGAGTGVGSWQTVERDLQADLEKYESGVTVETVDAVMIRGAGRIDNIAVDTETQPVEEESDFSVLEDAEDGLTAGWRVYAGGGNAADHIHNSFDASFNSNVIELSGPNGDTNDGFMFANPDESLLSVEANKVSWSHNFTGIYEIYFWVETSSGKRNIYYKPNDYDDGLNDWGTVYIGLGLGYNAGIGTWKTFTRDLQADLNKYESGVTITEIKAIMVRGSGMVDNIHCEYLTPVTENEILEDAEDNLTVRWQVYAGGGTVAENVLNILDSQRNSRVIQLAGPNGDLSDGFMLTDNDGNFWGSTKTQLSWAANFSANFTIYIWVETDAGKRYIFYTPEDVNQGYQSWNGVKYYGLGLGSDAKTGEWKDFSRNLQEDLNKFEQGVEILTVQTMMIRGGGFIDDVKLSYVSQSTEDMVIEDAEDEDVVGWTVYSGDGSIMNVYDTDRSSRVIDFSGLYYNTTDGIYINTAININSTSNQFEWSLKYDTDFVVYLLVETSDNVQKYLYYTPEETDRGTTVWGETEYIHKPLGTYDHTWQTFTRDLESDLSGDTIIKILKFCIRGTGRFDDVAVHSVTGAAKVSGGSLQKAGDIQGRTTLPEKLFNPYNDYKEPDNSILEDQFNPYVDGIQTGIDDDTKIPVKFDLGQNYPNPFNPSTTIKYAIPKTVTVRIVIYNIMGQIVKTLRNEECVPGYYSVVWDGRNNTGIVVSSGMYLYKITAGDFNKVKKMMFIK